MIDTNINQHVLWITLNRPESKNALNKQMIVQMTSALERHIHNKSCRVVIIHGAEGMFSSGADLDWMREAKKQSEEENLRDAQLFYKLFETLNNYPKPIICSVEKFAFGGATGIAACSDIVIADKNSLWGFPEVKLGLVPATIAPFIVTKIGVNHAKNLLLSGETFSAKKAKKIGLVNHLVSSAKLNDNIISISNSLINNSPEAIKETKQLLNNIIGKDGINPDQICSYIAKARLSKEGQEGVNAFFEKRPASWQVLN